MPIADEVSLGKHGGRNLLQKHYAREKEEVSKAHFVIFKGKNDTRYSITECNSSEVKQASLSEGCISGDETVFLVGGIEYQVNLECLAETAYV